MIGEFFSISASNINVFNPRLNTANNLAFGDLPTAVLDTIRNDAIGCDA